MNIKILKFIFLSILFYSCSDNDNQVKFDNKNLDQLTGTSISISKGSQKIVDAVAKELSKDNIHIYLKADYSSSESNEKRNKLKRATIIKSKRNYIKNYAEDLNSVEGNIKAEFYNEYNDISSILYSDSAKISNRYNNMIAEGNVVIYSPVTNLMLVGEKILWDNRAKRILSEDKVIIIRISDDNKISCFQESLEGFESDMDLSNYIFYKIKGTINEDCF